MLFRSLPEELKNVHVQRFISKSEDPSWLGKALGYRRERTGDEILERLSREKEKLNERFRQLLREVGSENKTPEKTEEEPAVKTSANSPNSPNTYAKIANWTVSFMDELGEKMPGNEAQSPSLSQKAASFRWYRRFPMTENLALNMSFGGPSLTVRKLIPGTSMTFGNRAPRLYVGTPIPGLAYQKYISKKPHKVKTEKDFDDDETDEKADTNNRTWSEFLFGSEYNTDRHDDE